MIRESQRMDQPPGGKRLHLRIDVDSYTGTREGLPRLVALLARHRIRATFFLTLGPDRWGQAIFRVFRRRGFLQKMLRTRAVHSYGLATCLRGTFLPAPIISGRLPDVLRSLTDTEHEIGVHCWDHLGWQDNLHRMSSEQVEAQVEEACEAFAGVFSRRPTFWAAPGWVTTPVAMRVLDAFKFRWMSNTRGLTPYLPVVDGEELETLEIPTTMPTLDEDLGRDGIETSNYVERFCERLCAQSNPVHTIHAETEGRGYLELFDALIVKLKGAGWEFAPLGTLAEECLAVRAPLPRRMVGYGEIPGRADRISIQGTCPQDA